MHDLVARLDQTVISSTDHEIIHWLGVTFRALIDSVDGIARRRERSKLWTLGSRPCVFRKPSLTRPSTWKRV